MNEAIGEAAVAQHTSGARREQQETSREATNPGPVPIRRGVDRSIFESDSRTSSCMHTPLHCTPLTQPHSHKYLFTRSRQANACIQPTNKHNSTAASLDRSSATTRLSSLSSVPSLDRRLDAQSSHSSARSVRCVAREWRMARPDSSGGCSERESSAAAFLCSRRCSPRLSQHPLAQQLHSPRVSHAALFRCPTCSARQWE